MKKEEMEAAFEQLMKTAAGFYATCPVEDAQGKPAIPLHELSHAPVLLILFKDGQVHTVDASPFMESKKGKQKLAFVSEISLRMPAVVATCIVAEAYSQVLAENHTPEDREKAIKHLMEEEKQADTFESLIFSFSSLESRGIAAVKIIRETDKRPMLGEVIPLCFDDGSDEKSKIEGAMASGEVGVKHKDFDLQTRTARPPNDKLH